MGNSSAIFDVRSTIDVVDSPRCGLADSYMWRKASLESIIRCGPVKTEVGGMHNNPKEDRCGQ